MNVVVVGLGLIGGSMVKDLRRVGFATRTFGVDINPEHGKKAVELGIVDEVVSLEEAAKVADLIIVSVPVDKIVVVLPKVLDLIQPHTTVTDVGSTKRVIVDSVRDHKNRGNYVASHPMSGTENSGPAAALEHLFDGKISIICDQEESRPQHVALVEKVYQSIGMKLAYMSSEEQDHSTAFVSHLPHATSFALANAVLAKEEGEIIFDLASGGFRSAVRLAKSSPEMWGPIFEQNHDYMVESLQVYIKHLQEFMDSISEKNYDKMMDLIGNANRIREVLDNKKPSLRKNEEMFVKLYTKK